MGLENIESLNDNTELFIRLFKEGDCKKKWIINHYFFKYVIPSIIAFALSGIYAIVDGYFVGNTIGDAGISAINIAYPIVALIQALGTGIGMGGAVYYSINAAEKKGKRAEEFIATSWWLLVIVSVISTIIIYSFSSKILGLLGADGIILTNATDYIKIIALGAILQILGTGMMPFIRNYGTLSGQCLRWLVDS